MISTEKEVGSSDVNATDERRELVDRIIASSRFAKCERLASLLAYVCDLTLKGREKEINEQRIGEAVFGRSRDYDSSIDGIVRTQASRLRRKLDLYFEEEGATEPIRLVIPRGGYVPLFEPRSSIQIEPPISPSAPITPFVISPEGLTKPEVQRSRSAVLAWALAATLAIVILVMLFKNRGAFTRPRSNSATVHPLWSQIFGEGQHTLIVPSDTGLVIWECIMNRNIGLAEYLSGWSGMMNQKIGSAEYLSGDYQAKHPATTTSALIDANRLGSRRYTSIVDLEVVQSLTQISQSEKSKPEVRYARDVRPNDLKQGNVILIGTTKANPWVELFEHNMNFVFSDDHVRQVYSVLNRAPEGDEPREWNSAYTDAQHRVYGIAAFVPNLNGNGNALILEGTSMAGTESAWDFISDDSQLLPFLQRIRHPDGTLPHFEVVLGTNNMSGSAMKDSILAWRTTK